MYCFSLEVDFENMVVVLHYIQELVVVEHMMLAFLVCFYCVLCKAHCERTIQYNP